MREPTRIAIAVCLAAGISSMSCEDIADPLDELAYRQGGTDADTGAFTDTFLETETDTDLECCTDEDCGPCQRCNDNYVCVAACTANEICCTTGDNTSVCKAWNECDYCSGHIYYHSGGDSYTDCCGIYGQTCVDTRTGPQTGSVGCQGNPGGSCSD